MAKTTHVHFFANFCFLAHSFPYSMGNRSTKSRTGAKIFGLKKKLNEGWFFLIHSSKVKSFVAHVLPNQENRFWFVWYRRYSTSQYNDFSFLKPAYCLAHWWGVCAWDEMFQQSLHFIGPDRESNKPKKQRSAKLGSGFCSYRFIQLLNILKFYSTRLYHSSEWFLGILGW